MVMFIKFILTFCHYIIHLCVFSLVCLMLCGCKLNVNLCVQHSTISVEIRFFVVVHNRSHSLTILTKKSVPKTHLHSFLQ